jgi:hypothetical protein
MMEVDGVTVVLVGMSANYVRDFSDLNIFTESNVVTIANLALQDDASQALFHSG